MYSVDVIQRTAQSPAEVAAHLNCPSVCRASCGMACERALVVVLVFLCSSLHPRSEALNGEDGCRWMGYLANSVVIAS